MKKILFTWLALIFLAPAFSQQHIIDSLRKVLETAPKDTARVNRLNELSYLLRRVNPREGLAFAEEADKLSASLGFEAGLMNSALSKSMNYFYVSSHDSSKLCASEAIEIAKKLKDGIKESSGHNMMGLNWYSTNNHSEALRHYDRAYAISDSLNDTLGMTKALNNRCNLFVALNDHPKAIEGMFQALRFAEVLNNIEGQAVAYANIGMVYRVTKDYDQSLSYLRKSLPLFEKINSLGGIAWIYNNLGLVYEHTAKYDSSLIMHRKSLEVRLKVGDKHEIANSYANISTLLSNLKKYDEAEENCLKALEMQKEIGDMEGEAISYNFLGTLYTTMKKYDLARKNLKLAAELLDRTFYDYVAPTTYRELARLDSATGHFADAYNNYKKYVTLRDTLRSRENNKKMLETQVGYEFEKKEALTKAAFDQERALQDAEVRKQQIITWIVSIALFLVLFFVYMVFKSLKITREQKKVIEQQKAVVEEHQKDIIDSINYARRLQDAILPPMEQVKKNFPASFVYYKPKDIVAGDFYWMQDAGDVLLIAAADCTGHGVPGAMVSVVCSNALNRTVKEFGQTDPGKILDKVTELVEENFSGSDDEVLDGMDISLLAIDRKNRKVRWSGAHNPLVFVENGELKELPPNKQPVGKYHHRQPFVTHTLDFSEGTVFYLFTDGYADQFGGPKGKKFKFRALKELLFSNSNLAPQEQMSKLDSNLKNWKGDLAQIDDICVIGLQL